MKGIFIKLIIITIMAFCVFASSNLIGEENLRNEQQHDWEKLANSKLTDKQIRELFPVPEKWKEWYKLEKEGKLPKHIKIKALSEKENKKVMKYMLLRKIHINKYRDKDYDFLKEKFMFNEAWVYNAVLAHRHFLVMIPLIHKELIDGNMKDLPGFAGGLVLEIYERLDENPEFFKNEYEYLKKEIPNAWKIYRNIENINIEAGAQWGFKAYCLHFLYKMGVNFDILFKEWIASRCTVGQCGYKYKYLDVINKKRIDYIDIRFKKLAKWNIDNKQLKDIRSDLYYFLEIGEINDVFDKYIQHCKLDIDGQDIRFLELILDYKKDPRVQDLARFYFNALKNGKISRFNEEYLRNLLEKEFGLKEEK